MSLSKPLNNTTSRQFLSGKMVFLKHLVMLHVFFLEANETIFQCGHSFTDVAPCRQNPDANLSPRIHFRMQICPDVHIKTCPSPMWTCPLADMVQCRRADMPPCKYFLIQACIRICPPCGHFQLQNDPVQTCRHVLMQTCPFADMPQRTLPVWKRPL